MRIRGGLQWEHLLEQWNRSRKWMGFARERLMWERKEYLVDLKIVEREAFYIMIFMSGYRVMPCWGYVLFCIPPAMIVQRLMD